MARRFICCILKSGGDFTPAHVDWLRRQCEQHMPDWDFQCWSDIPGVGRPMKYDWPKWWSKFEIYRCNLGPSLVIDLDTVFLKEFKLLPEHEDTVLALRNPWKDGFRAPEQIAGGFLYLPEDVQDTLWHEWMASKPGNVMSHYGGDDQPFLHDVLSDRCERIQDHYIDEVVSYKIHVKGVGIQPENKVVYFHGKPRPWDLDLPWIPKLGDDNGNEEHKHPCSELSLCSG